MFWALACRADSKLEPVCAKFEYGEKLLAITMRLEGRIYEIGNRVTRVESIIENLQQNKIISVCVSSTVLYTTRTKEI